MQRLNIPLHRNQRTTRLSRRVVSVYVALALTGYASLACAVSLWIGRDTTTASAPQGTALALHFEPNRFNWNAVEGALGNLTLVGSRPLTAANIKKFARGEFTVFLHADGERSVAVRARKEDLPLGEFDSLGILATETAPNVFLLSDHPTARMDWTPRRVWFGFVRMPGWWHIGEMHVTDEPTLRGPLYANASQIRVRLPKQSISQTNTDHFTQETIVFLATPVLPNIVSSEWISTFQTILRPIAMAATDYISMFARGEGVLALTHADNELGYIFQTLGEDNGVKKLQEFIRSIAAVQTPRRRDMNLPDGTVATELVVDPGFATVEETTVGGTLVSRVAGAGGSYVYAAERNGTAYISNRRELIEFAMGDSTEHENFCEGNAAYLNLAALVALPGTGAASRDTSVFSTFASSYRELSVDQGFIHTNIRACK